ncbi:MAG TPA: rhodanese-like domain-containing protein [Gemmataceae bacterium]
MPGTITREELKAKLDRGEKFYLVEALPLHNYISGHLPGAINLPLEELAERAPLRLPDKDAEVIVYSESETCQLSGMVAEELEKMGYRNVRDYTGGKADWVDSGNELEAGYPEAPEQPVPGASGP